MKNRISSHSERHLRDERLVDIQVDIPLYTYPRRKEESEDASPFQLKNINFSAKKGELIGIVGISGCGKSTLLKILSGNIIPDQGNICINFEEGKSHLYPGDDGSGLSVYRELTSIVSQESHVFSETLRFNISMGLESDQKTTVREFWDWVSKELPYLQHWGLDLEDQVDVERISAGQKQLISALRACYLHKSLVFFDEISSALDSDLEEALRKLVLIIQRQSMTFIVAHRVETVIHSDTLLVMKNGEIVDRGAHRELIGRSSYYKEFISQLN